MKAISDIETKIKQEFLQSMQSSQPLERHQEAIRSDLIGLHLCFRSKCSCGNGPLATLVHEFEAAFPQRGIPIRFCIHYYY